MHFNIIFPLTFKMVYLKSKQKIQISCNCNIKVYSIYDLHYNVDFNLVYKI